MVSATLVMINDYSTKGMLMKHFVLTGALLAACAFTAPAFAWDCSYWIQNTNPSAECYRPPVTSDPSSSATSDSTSNSRSNSRANSNASSNQHQGQQQAQGQGQTATGGDATATGGNQHQTATGGYAGAVSGATGGYSGAEANNAGNGNGSVDIGGDTSAYKSLGLALALPGLVAAPAVTQECMRHSRGWGGFSAGATGGTFYDKACVARVTCFALMDRYVFWGRIDAAMKQAEICGGVAMPPVAVVQDTSANDRRIEAQKAQTKAGK